MTDKRPSGTAPTWSRRGLLSASGLAGASLIAGISGCSDSSSDQSGNDLKKKIDNPPDNLNRTGFPIVEKPITLQFMTGRFSGNAKDYSKVANWKKYHKKTNIDVNWGLVPFENREEKRNLTLSGDDYPEVFNSMAFSIRDVGKYGRQGQFVKLNDLIDEYMPNLKKLMDADSTVKHGMTYPDGGIYGMPNIHDPKFLGLRIKYKPFVRKDWLDKFDMDVPTSTDELHRYLKMVKQKKPNGKSDAIPYCEDSGGVGHLKSALMGSFGVGNRGSTQGYLDADPKDEEKVRFYPVTEEYKALLEYLHRLYDQGLIAKNIFSVDRVKVQNAAAKGTYGSMIGMSPSAKFNAKHFTSTPALKGPNGQNTYNFVYSSLISLGGYIITDRCKHPLAAARWMDYFYSDDGARLFFMGVEGVSYKKTKNGVEFVDEITHPKKGQTSGEARKPYVTYGGGGYAGIVKEEYFKGVESSPQSIKAAKLLEPDSQSKIWPSFTFTQDEAEKVDSLADDIEKYVDESQDKFGTGDLHLSQWDKYVDKIKQMGLDDYMDIQQSAYDRYRKG